MIEFMKIIIDKNNSHSNNKQTLREKNTNYIQTEKSTLSKRVH